MNKPIEYTNNKLIELYPGLSWVFNGVLFTCERIESFLWQRSYVITAKETGHHNIHTLRVNRNSNRLRVEDFYQTYVKFCKSGDFL